MSAPPGSPAYYWAIGIGGTFTNATQVNSWTDQIASIVLSQAGGGSNAYNSSTGLIDFTAPNILASTPSITLSQPFTLAVIFNLQTSAGNPFAIWSSIMNMTTVRGTPAMNVTSDNGTNTIAWNATGMANSTTCTAIAVLNGASSKFYFNGSSMTINSGSTVGVGNMSSLAININGFGGGNGSTMSFGSVALYNSDASAFAVGTGQGTIDFWLRNPLAGGGTNPFDTATFDTATFDTTTFATKNFHV